MSSTAARDPITVYSFGPAWGIPVPTPSPFGLKLLTWMRFYDIPYVMKVQNDPAKGPKGKCPWAIMGGVPVGDSELIIDTLKARTGRDLDAALTPEQRATALAVRRMFDEHYHQAWEHQLFINDAAWQRGQEFFDQLPPGVRVLVKALARRALRKQLHARGVGRHSDADIVRMGIADLDATEALLGDKPYLFGDQPSDIDATVFAFVSLTYYVPSPSKLWTRVRESPRLTGYCDRILARYFKAG
jgi:glutathione S-transferase